MTVLPADPERTHAVLIGIEAYAAGSEWDLDGPARDVLAMYDWLIKHKVLPAHIQLVVSPLPRNAALFGEAGLPSLPATSGAIRRVLNAVREQDGELLLLFWAGHGAINQKEHRLFAADATTADKRNWHWEGLRDSLGSTYFSGLPRQIVIVDACADFRDDFQFTAPGDSLPVGEPLAHEQFVFFATQPGQTAKNLGTERRGLFSQELLREQSNPPAAVTWPPDMEAVAERVERRFEELRASGKATQAPRFEWRDWNGNFRDTSPPAPAKPRQSSGNAAPVELSFAQLTGLAGVLMACQPMRTEQRRNDLVHELRNDIANRIERRDDTRSDVMSIIRTAASYPGGLAELLGLIQLAEGPSTSWQRVEEYVSGSLAHLNISMGQEG